MTALRFGAFVLAIILGLLAGMPTTHAATLTVDTTVDDPVASACTDATPNDCSLRGAITKANGLPGTTTIVVPGGTYVLSQVTGCPFQSHQFGDFFLETTALCIRADMTIVGAGVGDTIVDGNQLGRTFVVGNKLVEIRGLTLRNGTVPTNTPGSFLGVLSGGGAITNGGSLTLVDCVAVDNNAVHDGGAIYNGHALTVLRTTIARNTAGDGGGGIANISFLEVTTLAVLDSSISSNLARAGDGGGIYNFGGVAIVSGSTISGNETTSLGGGISNENGSGVLTVTNSTISGNRSGSSGGGIFNAQSSVADLNDVTIANNVASLDNRGEAGGLSNNLGTFTIANTLIAGNRDQSNSSPDCRGPFISQGYNLIQNLGNCQVTGNATGNIFGQDPRLGILTDNGGSTSTHALGGASPAIDAGSPAAPGSGGAACSAVDQRGFLRPLGARCDIGAFERGGAFSVGRILPSSGGNAGSTSALISGSGFLPGTIVKLTRPGQPDVVANPIQADVGGSAINATFDLTGRPAGSWDVAVVNPDSTSRTLPGGFTIETGGAPDLWVDVIGPIRRGSAPLTIFYGNRGKVDALAVPLSISASASYGLTTRFEIAQPPSQPDQRLADFSQVPVTVRAGAPDAFINVPLLLPVVPAGFTGALQIVLVFPPGAPSSDLSVAIDTPYFNPTLSPQAVSGLVAGALAYAPLGLGLTIPPALVPGLEQYVRNQLQLVVDNGRKALVGSVGESQQIYSLPQLQIDAAIVGAVRALQP